MKYDVFISYSRQDYVDERGVVKADSPVKAILDILDAHQISYWFDKEGIYSGSEFVEVIANAIADSKMMLFVSSERSNESIYTAGEIFEAIENNKLIIPIKIDGSKYNKKFKLLLNPLDYIDITKPDAMSELLKAIEIEKTRIAKLEQEEALRREELKKREWRKAVKGDILDQVNELKKLKDTSKALLESIYKKLRSIDVSQKQCPVCGTKTDMEAEHCQTCGWFFPALTEIDGLGIEADKSALILAKSRWESTSTVDNSYLETEMTRLRDEVKELQKRNQRLTSHFNSQSSTLSKSGSTNPSLKKKFIAYILVFILGCVACFVSLLVIGMLIEDESPQTDQEAITAQHPEEVKSFDVNGVKFNMIYVEGGSFKMGYLRYSYSEYDSQPVHTVVLDSYYIAETEVTQELWQTIMRDNPSVNQGDSLPVNNVSWDDSQLFIRKLNNITNSDFRLPTEAEWEYAARGGNKSKGYLYSGSDTLDVVCSPLHTPVAQKRPNELGIYDMSGSVYEWCSDYYSSNYYDVSPRYNPQGPDGNPGYDHVYRGRREGWRSSNGEFDCHVSCLYERSASTKAKEDCGFRLVLSADTVK